MKGSKKIKKNIFFGLFSQLLIFAFGLIVPRLILTSYGSEVNGLLSTVTQIFVYVGLLEAGIGNASINALYKPVTEKNQYDISDVFSATQKYYRKVTMIYALCVVLISVIYPLCITSSLSYVEVALVIGFQGLSGALTFFFVAAYKQVLIADGRNYIISNINLIIYILTSAVKIVLMSFGVNVILLQAGYCLVHCVQVIIFLVIMKRKYPWLEKHSKPNMKALSQRRAFLVHEISGAVFSSTDTFVLSTFCSLMVASVYSVYNMVFVALNSLINSVNAGLYYILGQSYARNDGGYEKTHDSYDVLYMAFVFTLFSVAYMLMCPFVKLYTVGVTDIDYVDYLLPLLFVSIQLLSCGRATSARLITISGHAKATQGRSMIEAIINIIVSIALAKLIGIYGVLIGTIVALLYRTNDIIIYANKRILKRSPFKTYSKFLLFVLIFGLIVLVEYIIRDVLVRLCESYLTFIICGIAFTICSFLIYFGAVMLINKNIRKVVLGKLRKKRATNKEGL